MNERICIPSGGPPEGRCTHAQKRTAHITHPLSQVQNQIPPSCNPTSHHKKNTASPSPSPPIASYDRWQYAWSTNCSTTSPRRSRGGPHRKRTHAGPCAALAHIPPNRVVAQRRAVQPVVPRPRRPRASPRGRPVARRMQRPLVVQVQPLERRADLALRPTPLGCSASASFSP